MEQKLAEFRARKQAEKTMKKSADQPCRAQTEEDTAAQTDTTVTNESPTEKPADVRASAQSSRDRRDWLLDNALGRWLTKRQIVLSNLTLLKVLLWLVLLGLFVELEFGLPFFVISLFYWLYEGLRSPAAREPGELSAYSVFNPDCQPLLGTLTAEQLEGEMGYRPLANR
ncbi:SAYSvFN domain-containing protein 1-like [Plectropomus leopardus]|uniref:SAYSvFN domain-containing protein 1-like n=2 Tax=Plectropomus leopardus TaxID=160734 RepID=UPI001C4B759E|nr:SAYSvFN domain-containing protein 1-like [Plectropomus leopardus]XP_042359327.1 SAYSvFN domain-containing protein 1-like [Plectropomus leopardus]XP_042359328.1 SAYSvFN domain-containing protein 1-like [Plectropomus leopardus]